MTKPKLTAYEVTDIVVLSCCPWCDQEHIVTVPKDDLGKLVYDCDQCHRPFTLDNGD